MSLDNVIKFSNVRLSFPNLVKPQQRQNGGLSYKAAFIIHPQDPNLNRFMQVVSTLAAEKWKDKAQGVLTLCQQDRKKRCYSSGEEHVNQKSLKPYADYPGNVIVTAGQIEPAKPQIMDSHGNPIDPDNTMAWQMEARKLYGGCFVNVALKPWMQQNEHGPGIRCDLVAIQFAKDGDAFGEGKIDVTGMFGTVADPNPGVAAQPQAAMPPAPFPSAPGVPSFLQQR